MSNSKGQREGKIMYTFIGKGTRVIWAGEYGTVYQDSGSSNETVAIEFDNEQGVIVQRHKEQVSITVKPKVEENSHLIEEDREVGRLAVALLEEGGYVSLDSAVTVARGLYRAGARVRK